MPVAAGGDARDEVAQTPTLAFLKSGRGIDKEAAAMYRKMILEGVDSKVIIALLDELIVGTALSALDAVKKDVGGGQLSLSPKEEKMASKYQKMLKMGIPPERKMTSDEIGPTIISAVLDKIKSNKAQDKLADGEGLIAAKYQNMIKMEVPIDGIRHKMMMEEVNAKITNAVFDVLPKQQAKVGTIQLSSEEDAITEKYPKMLKMGVPLDGVKHKMDLEGVNFKVVSALVQEASSLATGDVESASANPPKKSTKAAGPTLLNEEEAIATTYHKMLKVCIPKEAGDTR
jgi:hypothetical protein